MANQDEEMLPVTNWKEKFEYVVKDRDKLREKLEELRQDYENCKSALNYREQHSDSRW